MELMQNSHSKEEEEDEEEELEEEEIIITTPSKEEEEESKQQQQHYPSNLSLSSSPSTTNPSWLGVGMIQNDDDHQNGGLGFLHHNFTNQQTNLKQLDFMELSLGNNNNKDVIVTNESQSNFQQGSTSNQKEEHEHEHEHEKEHMFDKVVTPSDVGKLNRLVIPKQHAEKYFPLDSTSNEKGLLLNFEDRNGKLWRFRYSYWNSSQSYVMTKGWSRFVKEKKLDAGDIVSFQRGVGELFRHRLYIDWRRRISNHHHHNLDPSSTTLFTPFFLPNPNQQNLSLRWGGANSRFYSLPYPSPQTPRHPQQQNHHDRFSQMNYNYHMYPFHQHGSGNYHHHDPSSVFYMRSLAPPSMSMVDQARQQQQQVVGGVNASHSQMIIDSVPVSHHHHHYQHQNQNQNQNHYHSGGNLTNSTNSAAKRLRLFGVNMECGNSSTNEETKCFIPSSSSSSSSQPSLQHLKVPPHEDNTLSQSTRFEDKRGGASMIFGLDPSLQYHYQKQ